jgi:hypothetical protein
MTTIDLDHFINYMRLSPGRMLDDLERRTEQYDLLVSTVGFMNLKNDGSDSTKYKIELMKIEMYENKLGRMLTNSIINNNRILTITTIKRMKEKMHDYLSLYEEAVECGVYNEQDYRIVSEERMMLHNLLAAIDLE